MNIEQLKEELLKAKKIEEEFEEYKKSVNEWKIRHQSKLKEIFNQIEKEKEELKLRHQVEKDQIQKKCVDFLVQKDKENKKRDEQLEKKLKEWKEIQDKRLKEALEKRQDPNNNTNEGITISFPSNFFSFSSNFEEEEEKEKLDPKKHIQKKIGALQKELDETSERLEQLRKANEFIPKFQQDIKLKTKMLHDLQKDLLSEKVLARKEKELFYEQDDKKGIVKDRERRVKLIKELPKIFFKIYQPDQFEIASLRGPLESGEIQDLGYASGKSVSTYPILMETGKRLGDPICDRFHFTQFKDYSIVAVADGCGWGPDSMLAAATASDIFVDYIKNNISKIKNTNQAAAWMIRAFSDAHDKIIGSRTQETIFTAGTTTMVGGIAMPLEENEESEKMKGSEQKWSFTCINLGDCKAYYRDSRTGEIRDITQGNRVNNDPKDPGGRLGPQLKGGLPDTRNLKAHFCECQPGDTISLVSDGVHDCLDPEHLGYTPADIGLACDDNKWESLAHSDQIEKFKVKWTENFLTNLFKQMGSPTPAKITDELVSFSWQTTNKTRTFMEQNKNARQPDDWKEYPGKMDHTTCLTFTIGNGMDLVKRSKQN